MRQLLSFAILASTLFLSLVYSTFVTSPRYAARLSIRNNGAAAVLSTTKRNIKFHSFDKIKKRGSGSSRNSGGGVYAYYCGGRLKSVYYPKDVQKTARNACKEFFDIHFHGTEKDKKRARYTGPRNGVDTTADLYAASLGLTGDKVLVSVEGLDADKESCIVRGVVRWTASGYINCRFELRHRQ